MHSSPRAAFTLIELLVVIAVIAILAAILFPVFAQARDKARQSACLGNEKQIALALAMYRQDWDGHGPFAGWPPGPRWEWNIHSPASHFELEWQFTIQPYLKSGAVLRCPGDRTPYQERPISYLYNNFAAYLREPVPEVGVDRPAEVVVLWEGYGPASSSQQKNPPLINGQPFPPAMFREYSQWAVEGRWLADLKRGLPRHSGRGNAIYMDLHAKWMPYGEGSTEKERVASLERAFPFPTAVAPSPPLPPPSQRGDWVRWYW